MAGPNRKYHYLLDDKGFLLTRQPNGGRSWRRSGVADVPTRRSADDQRYGNVSDTLDHPEVWDDWSGGFGQLYRRDETPNAVTWSMNFDLRFPRQAIHSQAPQLLTNTSASLAAKFRTNAEWFLDVPINVPSGGAVPPPGSGMVLALGHGYVTRFTPKDNYDAGAGAVFDVAIEMSQNTMPFGKRPAIYGSYVYIPNLSGTAFHRRNLSDAVFTQSNIASGGQISSWFQVASQQMWFQAAKGGYLRPYVAAADGNITGAGLGATVNVGNGFFNAADAVALENQLYVGFPDGPYQGNVTGTFNNVMSEIGAAVDLDNCADLDTFEGGLLAAAGPHIWWYKPSAIQSTLREVGPGGLGAVPSRGSGTRIGGRFTCVTSYGRWAYAGLFTGSGSVFMAGIDASPGLPYVWYPLHDFLGLNVKIKHIHVDQITTSSGGTRIPNRIWAATDASWGSQAGATSPMFYWEIPAGDDNPLLDTNFIPNPMGSAAMDLPLSDWAAPATSKLWRLNQVWADGLGRGTLSGVPEVEAALFYAVDASLSVFDLGSIPPSGNLATDPQVRWDTYYPSTAGSQAQGVGMKFRVESFSTGNGSFPATRAFHPQVTYRAIVNRGIVMPDVLETIEAHTRIADDLPDLTGAKMRTGATMLNELRAMAEGSAPSRLRDLAGNPLVVKVLGPIEETEVWQQGMEAPEVDATVRMAILTYSAGQIS